MNQILLTLLALTCLSGIWLWLSWRQDGLKLNEQRVVLHAASAGAVLAALLLDLSHETRGDALRLLLVFLGIASGVLLFLQRQRLRLLNTRLIAAHIGFGLAALGLMAVLVWMP